MRIGIVASELAPFAKAGGLADVAAALARFLAGRGHQVRLFAPLYGSIDLKGAEVHPVEFLTGMTVELGSHRYRLDVYTTPLPGSELWVYLVDCPALYHRGTLYTDHPDEHLRFLALCRAALDGFQRMAWAPEVIHVHDWHTAMVPLYLESVYAWDQLFAGTRTVLTLHNVAFQGVVGAAAAGDLGLDGHLGLLHQEDLAAGRINLLKHGLLYADLLTTVSRTHAREIQTPALGFGLDGVLRHRSGGLVGIVNGVDTGEWDPATDPLIPHHFSAEDLSGKAECKRELLETLELDFAPEAPLLGVVSRLTYQKGFDLAFEPLLEALAGTDLRLVALGSGESRYEELFRHLQGRFPHRVCFVNAYSNELAHWIEAGADLFLMPSRYEPCGLNQMYSQRYGTLPIVRKTGGLADTVEPWDPLSGGGTGFVFEHPDSQGVRWALGAALSTWRDREARTRLIANAMARDVSWKTAGERYLAAYRRVLGQD